MLLVAAACSSPKPPESPEPAAEPAAAEPDPSAATTPAATAPEAPATPSADAPAPQTLFVAAERAACQGEEPRECLKVRGSASEPWRLFYAAIDGFEYEPGYAYELRVEATPIANPPADAPSARYRLIEVVSKQKASM